METTIPTDIDMSAKLCNALVNPSSFIPSCFVSDICAADLDPPSTLYIPKIETIYSSP